MHGRISRTRSVHGAPAVNSTEPMVTSMRRAKIRACLCKEKPCSCRGINGMNSHPPGFTLPMLNAHMSALSSANTDLALLQIFTLHQSLTQAHFNNNNNCSNIDNNHNSSNSSNCSSNFELPKRHTTSPLVSSSVEEPEVDRRTMKGAAELPRQSFSRRKKSSSNRNNQPSDAKKYHCDFCGDSFGYKHVLQNHVRTHTGEKPFKCTVVECGKRFTRDHHLKTHMRLHTGEKPFQCKNCEKRFVQVANLRRHMRVHTGERPYHCNVGMCDISFSDSNQLNAHRLIHHKKCKPDPDAKVTHNECKPDPDARVTHNEFKPDPDAEVEKKVKEEALPLNYFYYQNYFRQNQPQDEPEDLSLKKSPT